MRAYPSDSDLKDLDDEKWKEEIDPRLLALFEWENDPRVLELTELAVRLRQEQVWFSAPCALFRNGKRWAWQVLLCPGCGGKHEHDGGPLGSDPRERLTLVEMACDIKRIGYAARSWGYVLGAEDYADVVSMLREAEKEMAAGVQA